MVVINGLKIWNKIEEDAFEIVGRRPAHVVTKVGPVDAQAEGIRTYLKIHLKDKGKETDRRAVYLFVCENPKAEMFKWMWIRDE
jgi:hypothetical protein